MDETIKSSRPITERINSRKLIYAIIASGILGAIAASIFGLMVVNGKENLAMFLGKAVVTGIVIGYTLKHFLPVYQRLDNPKTVILLAIALSTFSFIFWYAADSAATISLVASENDYLKSIGANNQLVVFQKIVLHPQTLVTVFLAKEFDTVELFPESEISAAWTWPGIQPDQLLFLLITSILAIGTARMIDSSDIKKIQNSK
ncbi:MAG TPA: hypothetical protein VI875_00250 [Candidatus Norongarragalinales archaeon]|nr:hypothetical protein [Candidatus Norongarragalinales archaeon]